MALLQECHPIWSKKKYDIAMTDIETRLQPVRKATSVGLVVVASKNLKFLYKLSQICLRFFQCQMNWEN